MRQMNVEGSGKTVTDFSSFCEGDVDPSLNKRIRTLVDSTHDYIVYLDDEMFVEWSLTDQHKVSPSRFDSVANAIAHLESMCLTQLSRDQREPFGRLLAEAMARTLGGGNGEKVKAALATARDYLDARGTENARRWYLQGAGITGLTALAIAGLVLLVRRGVSDPGWLDFLEIATGAMLGGVGALLSIASRTEDIRIEPVAGPKIHRFEGAIRVLVGVAAALFVAIAIKAGLLLGTFYSSNLRFLASLVACLVAGASERWVPGLIKRMEQSVDTDGKQLGE